MILSTTIKKVFLSFAQQLFTTVQPLGLVWDVDPRKTQIFIADNYSVSPEIVESMPAIILVRGNAAWAQTSIDQRLSTSLLNDHKLRKDLVRLSVTLQCTSKNGIEAEKIADTLFTSLVGYKDQFRKNGIHQILSISMGEERLVRADSTERLFAIPINVMFAVESEVAYTVDDYELLITVAGMQTLQHIDYEYSPGSGINYFNPPVSGAAMLATYADAITLDQIVEVPSGIVDGINRHFTLSHTVYGYYPPFNIYNDDQLNVSS